MNGDDNQNERETVRLPSARAAQKQKEAERGENPLVVDPIGVGAHEAETDEKPLPQDVLDAALEEASEADHTRETKESLQPPLEVGKLKKRETEQVTAPMRMPDLSGEDADDDDFDAPPVASTRKTST